MTPERGIYRPGETIHLTALVRDTRANAVDDLPMTLVVERPDGVEFLRKTLSDGGARRLHLRRPAAGRTPCAARGACGCSPTRRAPRSPTPPCWSRISSRSGWPSTSAPTPRRSTRVDADDDRPRRALSLRRLGARTSPSRARSRSTPTDTLAGLPGLPLRPDRGERRADARAGRDRRGHRRGRQGDVRRHDAGRAGLDQAVRRDAHRARRRHQRPRGRAHHHAAARRRRADDRHQAELRRRRRRKAQRRASRRSWWRRTARRSPRPACRGSSSGSRRTTSGTAPTGAGTTS